MLQQIRDNMTGFLAAFILTVLVVPFAFFGIESYFVSAPQNAVAQVNDESITDQEFRNSFQGYLSQMSSMFGANFDITEFDQPIIRRQHLDRMINQRLLEQATRDAGMAVSREELQETISSIPAFQVGGQFDPEVYRTLLASRGQSASQFEQDLAQQLLVGQLAGAIQGSAIATDSEVAALARLRFQQRSFDWVRFPIADFGQELEIPEEDIQAYYEAHPEQFNQDQQVVVEYVELSADQFANQVEMDDATLEARYEEQKGRFINPERRLASHILVTVPRDADDATRESARQRAADLAEQARAEGADFAAIASENSDDAGSAASGGDLGWVGPGDMVQSFEEALYAMAEGSVSDPVETAFGYHVIQLREVRAPDGMSFEEARDQLSEEFFAEETERLYLEQADRLVDMVYEDPTTLQPISQELGLEIQVSEPFDRSGGMGIASNPEVVEQAFSDLVLLEGDSSEPIEMAPNHLLVLRVRESIPSQLKPLDEVRSEIVAQLTSERRKALAREAAEALLATVEAGTSLEEAAAAIEREVQSIEDTRRSNPLVEQELLDQIFLLRRPPEGAAMAVLEGNQAAALVVLEEVSDGALDPEQPIQAQQLARQIANASAQLENNALLEQLRAGADIEVFEDRLSVN